VSWKSKILPIKVLDASGTGAYTDIIEGLIYAADHGAHIINLSLGGYGYSEMMKDAVQYAYDKNIVIVAGTGNDGSNYPIYPAALPHVLGVTATGAKDEKWTYANFGNFVDLAAPGVGILSATVGGGYGYGSGTSQAAAFVSGVAALVKAANGTFTNTQIENRLQTSAVDLGVSGRDSTFGAGRVNALKALSTGR
jgi:subtilisin family serine protease